MIIVWNYRWRARRHDNIVTLPEWSPIFGHFVEITSNYEDIIEHTYSLVKRADFPKVAAFTSFTPFYGILLMDPEITKFVFDTKFESFQKGLRIQKELEEMLGDGIFTSDPPKWKFHRKSYVKQKKKRTTKEFVHNYYCNI